MTLPCKIYGVDKSGYMCLLYIGGETEKHELGFYGKDD